MKKCVKCNKTITCSCSVVTIDGKIYCKQCAIEIFKNRNNNVKNTTTTNVSNGNVNNNIMNPDLFNIKIIR